MSFKYNITQNCNGNIINRLYNADYTNLTMATQAFVVKPIMTQPKL